MGKLRLSMACSNYDRTRALFDGRVSVDGIELTYLDLPIEEIFFRMLRHREFDVAEMSLSFYVLSLFSENPRLIAIPVFPSRFFRHSCIFIHRDSGIREPSDLIDCDHGANTREFLQREKTESLNISDCEVLRFHDGGKLRSG
jgi:4,5-dihydroxyphthalate decarboxylase